ncbi:hypothetical protein BH23BAC1_BH23BAC1_23130 [soil metagenome]
MTIIKKLITAVSKLAQKGKAIKGEEGVNSCFNHIKKFDNEETAIKIFNQQKEKFLDIDYWTSLSDIENMAFLHYDGKGEKVRRKIKVNDFVKVELPGPLPDYWVKIEIIKESPEKVEITVRPTYDPTKRPLEKEVTAHFFDRDTLNILIFEREREKLKAEVRGISAVVNNEGTQAGDHEVLNTTVAVGGWFGMQKRQWESFTKNLAEPQKKE